MGRTQDNIEQTVHTTGSGLLNEFGNLLASEVNNYVTPPVYVESSSALVNETITLQKLKDADETTDTTTANYTVGQYIYQSTSGILYECILNSTSGLLLTNATYFTAITSNTLTVSGDFIYTIDRALKKESVSNVTVDFATASDGVNYVAKEHLQNSYIFSTTKPEIVDLEPFDFRNKYWMLNGSWYTNNGVNIKSSANPFGDSSLISKLELDTNSTDTTTTYNGTDTSITYSNNTAIFNGSTSKIETASKNLTASYTISVKVRHDGVLAGSNIVIGGKLSSSGEINIRSSGDFQLGLQNDSGSIVYPMGFEEGKEYVLAYSRNHLTGEVRMYINGLLVHSDIARVVDRTVSCTFDRLGQPFDGSGSSPWNGMVDQLEIYNKVLTDAEVQQVYLQETKNVVELTNQPSWMPYPFMVASGTPQQELDEAYGYEPLASVVFDNVELSGNLDVGKKVAAGEYLGKNACTAWVNFDGTTTPPTILDSYNVSDVVRTQTGYYDIYFEEPMDNNAFASVATTDGGNIYANVAGTQVDKITVRTRTDSGSYFNSSPKVQVIGGKN